MDRDMDAIRKIVLAVKTAEEGVEVSSVGGLNDLIFNYNANLLIEAALAEGRKLESGYPPTISQVDLWKLTWAGHDFADAIKDETIWNKAKEKFIKPGVSFTFPILLEYLKSLIV